MQLKLLDNAAQVYEYALRDSEAYCKLWLAHSDKWPAPERELSELPVSSKRHVDMPI